MIIVSSHQVIPVERAQQRPRRNCNDIGSLLSRLLRRAPHLNEPPQLLFPCATVMAFRNGYGQMVALPRLHQKCAWSGSAFPHYSRGQHISVRIVSVSTVSISGITVEMLIQKTFSAQVVVDAN